MDYNFAYAVMWFFSCPWVVKSVALSCLALALAASLIRIGG